MSLSLRPRGHWCLTAKLATCPLLFALGMPVSSQDALVPSSMMNVVVMDVGQHCPQLFRADSSWVSGWNQPISTTWELGNAGSRAPLGLPMQTPRAAQPTPPPPGDMGARWSWNTSDRDGGSSPHALPSLCPSSGSPSPCLLTPGHTLFCFTSLPGTLLPARPPWADQLCSLKPGRSCAKKFSSSPRRVRAGEWLGGDASPCVPQVLKYLCIPTQSCLTLQPHGW